MNLKTTAALLSAMALCVYWMNRAEPLDSKLWYIWYAAEILLLLAAAWFTAERK